MVESMLVLTVLGIVTSVSLGRLHQLLAEQRVARAATTIQGDVEAAFAIAGRNRRPIRIAWNASKMQLDVTDRSGTVSYRTLSLKSDAYALEPGSVTVSLTPLEIYPNGLAADTLLVSITGYKTNKRVRVSRAGLVQVQ